MTFISPTGRRYSANILKNGTFAFHKGFPPGVYKIAEEANPPSFAPGAAPVQIPAKYSVEATRIVLDAVRGENVTDLALQSMDR